MSSVLWARYDDEAVLTLETLNPPPGLLHPRRFILLTKDNPIVCIGRTSKRNSIFEATKNNAYFESAVISREHAQLDLDVQTKQVYIKDVGSMHGTFVNSSILLKNESMPLEDGDLLKFGIPIERGADTHPPCEIKAHVSYGATPRPADRPTVFRVPDETDVEDLSSDDDEVQIQNTSRILKDNNFHPAALDSTPTKTSIDLTSDEQYPTSSDRAEIGTSPSGTEKKSTIMDLVDLTSMENEELQSELEELEEEAFGSIMSDISYDDQDDDGQDSGNPEMADGEARVSLSDALGVTQDSAWSSPSASPSSSRSPSPYSEASVASDASVDGDSLSIRELEEHYLKEQNAINFESDIDEDDERPTRDFAESAVHNIVTNNFESGPNDGIPISMSGAINSSDLPEQSESAGAPPATVEAKSYMLNTHLPPMNPPTKLPSLSAAQFTPLPNMRLPPIFDTMERPVHPSVPVPSQISAAQELGAKTGKMEYFTAREENRMNLHISPPLSLNFPTYQPYDWSQFQENSKCQPSRALPQTSNVPEERCEPQVQEAVKPPSYTESRLPEQLNTESGAWQDSGVKFLNSPPDELPVPTLHAKDPPLDDTSAFQFEMSKRVANTAKLAEHSAKEMQKAQQYLLGKEKAQAGVEARQHERDTAEESNTVKLFEETLQTQTKSSGKPSLKRKAEEISLLTPEEQHSEATRGLREASEPEEAPPNRHLCHHVRRARPMYPRDSRPTKRLRRVAEAFGIAALGGAAVMGALIATAPSF